MPPIRIASPRSGTRCTRRRNPRAGGTPAPPRQVVEATRPASGAAGRACRDRRDSSRSANPEAVHRFEQDCDRGTSGSIHHPLDSARAGARRASASDRDVARALDLTGFCAVHQRQQADRQGPRPRAARAAQRRRQRSAEPPELASGVVLPGLDVAAVRHYCEQWAMIRGSPVDARFFLVPVRPSLV